MQSLAPQSAAQSSERTFLRQISLILFALKLLTRVDESSQSTP